MVGETEWIFCAKLCARSTIWALCQNIDEIDPGSPKSYAEYASMWTLLAFCVRVGIFKPSSLYLGHTFLKFSFSPENFWVLKKCFVWFFWTIDLSVIMGIFLVMKK